MWRAVCAALFSLLMGTAIAADYRAGVMDYRGYLRHLQAGDRLLLEAGDYLQGLPLHKLSGRAGQPIVVEAADPDAPPRFIARPGANTISLVDVRYLIVRHLELDGRNMPVDAVKAEGHSRYADYITLEHLSIHDHAALQQNVAISTKCPAIGWVVRNNRIDRVGTGMYLGDSDGSDAFVGGVIEGNWVGRTLGYNLQIKHQSTRPVGSADRQDTVIRYNVFSKQGALPGPLARPNVLLGHLPLTGMGSEDRYLVYGNLFLHNPSEALLQAEGRVAVYDNVFINGDGDAIRIQPHNDVPRDMMIFSNTVLATGTGIQVRRSKGSVYRQRLISNVVAAAVPVQGGEDAHNTMLPYQTDWVEIAVPKLSAWLLGRSPGKPRIPETLMRELATYPGWSSAPYPGAPRIPAWLNTLNAGTP
jgi:hypothetical protein